MEKHIIIGVHITDRFNKATEVQHLFTVYGCNIKTRLGLHEVEKVCSPSGLILLEMHGEEERCHELADKLKDVEGVEVQTMVFGH